MADIFLSYRNTPERRAYAMRLATILRAYGLSVWWDHGLDAGESYRARVSAELAAARAVSPLWCELSVLSRWVQMESELGKDKLVPIRLQRVPPPPEFEAIQAADLTDWNGSAVHPRLTAFVAGLCKRLGKPFATPTDMLEELSKLPPLPLLPTASTVIGQAERESARALGSTSAGHARPSLRFGAVLAAALVAVIVLGGGFYAWRLTQGGEPLAEAPKAAAAPVASLQTGVDLSVAPPTLQNATPPAVTAASATLAPHPVTVATQATAVAPPTTDDGARSQAGIAIAIPKPIYKVGENFTFSIASDRDCSFIVFTIDAGKSLQCLDPATPGMAALLGDPLVKAGETRRIPVADAPGRLRVDPPTGRYTLGVVCGPEEFKRLGYDKIICSSPEVAASRGLTAVLGAPGGAFANLGVHGNTVDFTIVTGN